MKTISILLITIATCLGVFSLIKAKNSGTYDKLYEKPVKVNLNKSNAVEGASSFKAELVSEEQLKVSERKSTSASKEPEGLPSEASIISNRETASEKHAVETRAKSAKKRLDPKLYSRAALIEEEEFVEVVDSIESPVHAIDDKVLSEAETALKKLD